MMQLTHLDSIECFVHGDVLIFHKWIFFLCALFLFNLCLCSLLICWLQSLFSRFVSVNLTLLFGFNSNLIILFEKKKKRFSNHKVLIEIYRSILMFQFNPKLQSKHIFDFVNRPHFRILHSNHIFKLTNRRLVIASHFLINNYNNLILFNFNSLHLILAHLLVQPDWRLNSKT